MATDVIDRPEMSRFELAVDGDLAVANYRIEGGRVVLTHTEVPERLEGRGIGSRMARGVFETLRRRGQKAVPLCPFMAAYVKRHPEFEGVVEG